MPKTSVKINLAMSTVLPHLLDQDGQVPQELSSRELNIVNFFGNIVTSVSGSRELRCSDPIRCRKYRGKKRCNGSIAAWCEEESELSPIEWCCTDCGEGGVINAWQGSIFDKKELRHKKVHEHIGKGVWLNDSRLDEVKMLLQARPGDNYVSYLSYPSNRIVVHKDQNGIVRLNLPTLLVIELFQREIITSRSNSVTLRIGHGCAKQYRFSQIKYPSNCEGAVGIEFLPEV